MIAKDDAWLAARDYWLGGMSAVVTLALHEMPNDWATYADWERADYALRRRVRRMAATAGIAMDGTTVSLTINYMHRHIEADIISEQWRIGRWTVGHRFFAGGEDPISFEVPA